MLRGERVILRSMERGDLQRWHQLLNREVELVSLGWGPWQPISLASVERRFEKNQEGDEPPWFAIETDGKLIGHLGLKHWSWDRRAGTAELAMSIFDPDYLGRGYGREALGLLLDWAFREHNWRRIWLQTLAVNERAVRAYRACGFVEEGIWRAHDYFDGAYHDVVLMGLLREEWEARRARRHQGDAS